MIPSHWTTPTFFSRIYVKQGTVLEELSFSYYYHSKYMTQVVHILVIPVFFYFVTLFLYTLSGNSILVPLLVWALPFTVYTILCIDNGLGVLFGCWYLICLINTRFLIGPMLLEATSLSPTIASFLGAVLSLALIGSSHAIFERASPPFRLFEGLVSTPQIMILLGMCWVTGYRKELVRAVVNKAVMWDQTPFKRPGYVCEDGLMFEHDPKD